jgi:hypothetical protein
LVEEDVLINEYNPTFAMPCQKLSKDGMNQSMVDSKAWKHIDAMWPNFN